MYRDLIIEHAEKFKQNCVQLGLISSHGFPCWIEYCNFSVLRLLDLWWDYDWFRVSSRMLDFYFFARVVSDIGDRTMFTYNVDILMHERFKLFLRSYHRVNPLSEQEILFLKEAYRFFLLTYVVKYGRFFFHELFANTLQKETFETHLPGLDDQSDASCLMIFLTKLFSPTRKLHSMNYSSFSHVIDTYKVVMLDSYGVVKNHKGLIEGVQESIRTLKQKGKTFRLLTNDASRSQEQQLESLQQLGLNDIELHEIITSGMMARQFLEQKITSGRIAYLGTQNSAEYILQSGLQHVAAGEVDPNDIDDITAFVFLMTKVLIGIRISTKRSTCYVKKQCLLY